MQRPNEFYRKAVGYNSDADSTARAVMQYPVFLHTNSLLPYLAMMHAELVYNNDMPRAALVALLSQEIGYDDGAELRQWLEARATPERDYWLVQILAIVAAIPF